MAFASLALTVSAQGPLKSGINLGDLNQNAKPGDDFYQFACGGWMKANPLPAAYSRFGSFDRLARDNNERINKILTELSGKTSARGSVEQKLGDFYKLAMDSTRRNREGVAPAIFLTHAWRDGNGEAVGHSVPSARTSDEVGQNVPSEGGGRSWRAISATRRARSYTIG